MMIRRYLWLLLALPLVTAAAGPGVGYGPGGGIPKHDHSSDAEGGPLGDVTADELTIGSSTRETDSNLFLKTATGGFQFVVGGATGNSAFSNLNADGTSAGFFFRSFHGNGAVELLYDGDARLDTTSAGVSVTGDLSVSGDATVAGSAVPWHAMLFANSSGTILEKMNVTTLTNVTGLGKWQVDFDGPPVGYSNPICTCTASATSDATCVIGASTGASAFDVLTFSAGSLADVGFMLVCMAPPSS